jgi:four helix bundle protein
VAENRCHTSRGRVENSRVQDFRRLLVWQRAHELVLSVRRGIRGFPRSERGSLKSQMVNAAESIAFNIVEGCGSTSSKEFARFLDISIKSTCELEYQLQLATDCNLLSRRVWSPLSAETVEIRRMLCGLRRKVLNTTPPQYRPTDNH